MQTGLEFKQTNWDKALKQAITRGLTKATILIRNQAVKECPIKTGRLLNSIKRESDDKKGKVYTNVEYASVVEYGVKREYKIRVKNKQVLSDGKVFFGKEVIHPPIKAQPFMRPALYNNKDKILGIVKNEILKARAK